MKQILILATALCLLAGCASMKPANEDLTRYTGIWNSIGPQAVIIAISQLNVKEDGKFELKIISVGAERTENKLFGTSNVIDSRLVLSVEKCDGQIEKEIPFKLYGDIEEGILILRDLDGKAIFEYKKTE